MSKSDWELSMKETSDLDLNSLMGLDGIRVGREVLQPNTFP
jgi:hypothetical protein